MSNRENLLEWAITEENEQFVGSDFLGRKTGLMTFNSDEIKKVYTAVFVSENVVNRVAKESECLILTHHNFDYYEDGRGLLPIRAQLFRKLKETGNSIYVAHAPLDTHKVYGTSISLSELCGVKVDKLFFDYHGSPVGVIGHIDACEFSSFAEHVRSRLSRPYVTLVECSARVEKVAVAAGGGDLPELLQEVYDNGCDTLLTGTVEHRWLNPIVQQGNKKFHELNRRLKRNLIGGTHYATERPAMIKVTELICNYGIDCSYCEDQGLLNAI
ncbi:MAG TPA: Nif3-like dinuclear metal center hexameric protein [Candidatus Kryptobacter bacterium]|nr:Nif3-like dinuclear metal center hexameric protein [Candidatus Kryptobacter bacterium]